MDKKSQNPPKNSSKTNKSIKKMANPTIEQKNLKLELKKTQEELDRVIKENEMLINTAKQTLADFQNYKRRVEEQHKNISTFATENLILELLPFIDNLERAIKAIPKDKEADEWAKGINQIYQQFTQTLEKQGLQAIQSVGEPLDPEKHEALMQAPGEKDIIIEEMEKGYILGEKVIRAAKVKVGDGSK